MINPYVIGLAALTLIASFGLGYIQGKEHGLVQYYELRANVETQTAKLQADADQARADSERITADVSTAWSNALDYHRDNPRIVRVQSPASRCEAGLRPDTPTAFKPDAAAAQSGLDPAINVAAEECEARLNNAVLDAAMVLHLQHWINEMHEVSNVQR